MRCNWAISPSHGTPHRGGNFTPATAEETWKRRYGDCKGKTALLLALLGELGIEAEAVLANNNMLDDGLDERLPNPMMFNHVLVRATIEGEQYWLDGTLPPVAAPMERPLAPYRWVLPLSDAGSDIERIEWLPFAEPRNLELFEIDASAGFDAPAQIRQTMIVRGPQAFAEYVQFSSASDAQLENAFRQELEGSSSWDEVEDVNWRFDKEEQASVLEIVGTGPVDWDRDEWGVSLILPGGGFNPPQRRQRSSTQDQDAPYWEQADYSCSVTTVRLPDETDPANWSYNSTFMNMMYGRLYDRKFEKHGNEITMRRASATLLEETSPQTAAQDNQRLADFDNSMARIEFDPDDDIAPDTQKLLPATYEVDWLTDSSACRPGVALGAVKVRE